MEALKGLLRLAIYVFDIFLFYDFYHRLFKCKIRNTASGTAIAGTAAVLCCCTDRLLLKLLLLAIMGWALYRRPLGELCCHTLLYMALRISVESLIQSFVDYGKLPVLSSPPYPVLAGWPLAAGISPALVTFLIYRTAFHFILPAGGLTVGCFPADCYVPASVLPFLILYLSETSPSLFTDTPWKAAAVLLAAGAQFILSIRLCALRAETVKLAYLEKGRNLERRHYTELDRINEEYGIYAHDLRHLFRTIHVLAGQDKGEQIHKLLLEMEVRLQTVEKRNYCSHPILDALLSEQEEAALRIGVALEITVVRPICLPGFSDMDLIIMLGNLLENAVEAAGRCVGSRTAACRIAMSENGKFLIIIIKNSFPTLPGMRTGRRYPSSKGQEHGLGIISVEETVAKYHGLLEMGAEGKQYCAKLILPAEPGRDFI